MHTSNSAMNEIVFFEVRKTWISKKFSITEKFSMVNQVSSNQSNDELATAFVNALAETLAIMA